MYEVFLNERKIVITQAVKNPKLKEGIISENLLSKKEVKNWFSAFISSKENIAILTHNDIEKFWNQTFINTFKKVPAAGGVVIRNNKLLFILRNDKWDLPKGKLDINETPKIAAVREVEEECGISGHQIVKPLPCTYHLFQSPFKDTFGKWILKETFWYEMIYTGANDGIPEIEENITEVRWFAKNELNLVLQNTYENLKSLIMLYKE